MKSSLLASLLGDDILIADGGEVPGLPQFRATVSLTLPVPIVDLSIVHVVPFWSKKAPASLARRIRDLAALNQDNSRTYYQVRDDAKEVAEQLLTLGDMAYAEVLRDVLNQPGGFFRAYHLPAAIFGTPRARYALRGADDVRLLAGILLRAYGRQGVREPVAPHTFLMGPIRTLLGSAVDAVDQHDRDLEPAMSALADLLALEHPDLAALTGRCAPRLRALSRPRFESLLRRWMGADRCLGTQLAILRTGTDGNAGAFEELLLVLLDAPQPEPTRDWQARWAAARRQVDGARLRQMLIQVIETCHAPDRIVNDAGVTLTRGAIWALADWRDWQARDVLQSIVLEDPPGDIPANAALWSLAKANDEESVARLIRIGDKVRHRGLKTRAAELLRRAAATRNQSPESLTDQLVPSHGLNESAQRSWDLDGYHVVIRLTPAGDVERLITGPDGKAKAGVPKSIQGDPSTSWQEIMKTTRDLKATLVAQKHRLEEAMIDGRSWSLAAWQASIGTNPVMASMARRLVWRAAVDNASAYVMPDDGGNWKMHAGETFAVPVGAMLVVAHLLEMPPGEVDGWQVRIVADGIVQPFRQLFREVYVLTPVEQQAGDHSARFVGHSVPLAQVYALTKTRGWRGKLGLAGFDGAGEGWKEFPTRNLRVGLRHGGEDPQQNLGVIEEVFFERRQPSPSRTPTWRQVPLEQVDPVAFSEAMRDVDLIVSAASLGRQFTSAEWEALHQEERDAWLVAQPRSEYLTQASARTRGELLLKLAPLLGIDNRVHIDGHFAVVEGKLGRYRVHLGTSTIYMEPGRRAMCIVPAKQERRRLLLPFEEGDYMASLIFSKIVMLLDDDKIADETILRQMGWRPSA